MSGIVRAETGEIVRVSDNGYLTIVSGGRGITVKLTGEERAEVAAFLISVREGVGR